MICSQNELVAALQKALQAAGAPTGIAEDVATAGAWIAAQRGDGIGAVLAGLKSPLPEVCRQDRDGDKVSFHDARMVLAGPSALDLLQAGVCREVVFYNSDSALLIAGLAANRSSNDEDMHYIISSDHAPPSTHTVDTLGSLQGSHGTIIRVVGADAQAKTANISTEIKVEPQAWDRLLRLAAAMYVPSSEQSRTAGAGAGLLDND